MTSWRWCEVFPPRGMSHDEVTAVTRVLTGRPRFGALELQPLVVFELWLYPDRIRWLIGMDERIADRLPGEFRAQCSDLTFVPLDDPQRPKVLTGRELRTRSLTYPVSTFDPVPWQAIIPGGTCRRDKFHISKKSPEPGLLMPPQFEFHINSVRFHEPTIQKLALKYGKRVEIV